ncbi:MAG: aminotransferase class IV [Gammaproteobacteria bacterium]
MKQQFNPANAEIKININGTLHGRDDARVSVFDSVVQGGDAVWEGLRVYDGRIFRLTAHLDRLAASAAALAFDSVPTHDEIRTQIRRTLDANAMHDGVHIRLTLTRGIKVTSGMDPRLNTSGPTLIVLAEHKAPVYDKTGLTLITAATRRIPPDCLDQKIHSCNLLNSILAKIEANAAGADDAMMLDYQGNIAETNATHLFFNLDGVLVTPFTTSCPEGVTRAAVLSLCAQHGIESKVANITLAEAYRAREIFCTGTMGELAAVTRLDGRGIGEGSRGELCTRLSALYQELTRREGEAP